MCSCSLPTNPTFMKNVIPSVCENSLRGWVLVFCHFASCTCGAVANQTLRRKVFLILSPCLFIYTTTKHVRNASILALSLVMLEMLFGVWMLPESACCLPPKSAVSALTELPPQLKPIFPSKRLPTNYSITLAEDAPAHMTANDEKLVKSVPIPEYLSFSYCSLQSVGKAEPRLQNRRYGVESCRAHSLCCHSQKSCRPGAASTVYFPSVTDYNSL